MNPTPEQALSRVNTRSAATQFELARFAQQWLLNNYQGFANVGETAEGLCAAIAKYEVKS